MGIWDILCIEPTSDVSVIKKVYAAKLKLHHPEDDPEGYQRLREAYDKAVKQAKQKSVKLPFPNNKIHESTELPPNSSIHNKIVLKDTVLENENNEIVIPPKIKLTNQDTIFSDENNNIVIPPKIVLTGENISSYVNIHELNIEFIRKLTELYEEYFSRINGDKWGELLNSEIMWNIDNKKVLSINILDFLLDHRNLPYNVWKLLDMSFHWRETDNYTYSKYGNLIDYIHRQLSQKRPIGYDFIKNDTNIDFDKYLSLRDSAFYFFNKQDSMAATAEIRKAKLIYTNDPDLICLEGRLCMFRTSDNTLSIYNRALSINCNHVESLIQRADIYFNTDKFDLAAIDYKKVLELEPDNHEILLQAVEAFYKAGMLEDTKSLVKKILVLNPSSPSVILKLNEMKRVLLKKVKEDIRNNPQDDELKECHRLLKPGSKYKVKSRRKYMDNDYVLRRTLACLVDYFILTALYMLMAVAALMFNLPNLDPLITTSAIFIPIFIIYETAFTYSKYSASPGKLLLNIRVTFKDKTLLKSLLRAIFKCLTTVLFLHIVSLIIIEIRKNKQSIHDMVIGSFVIKNKSRRQFSNEMDTVNGQNSMSTTWIGAIFLGTTILVFTIIGCGSSWYDSFQNGNPEIMYKTNGIVIDKSNVEPYLGIWVNESDIKCFSIGYSGGQLYINTSEESLIPVFENSILREIKSERMVEYTIINLKNDTMEVVPGSINKLRKVQIMMKLYKRK